MDSTIRFSAQQYYLQKSIMENDVVGIMLFDIKRQKPIAFNQRILEMYRISEDDFRKMHPLQFTPEMLANGVNASEKLKAIQEEASQKGDLKFEWDQKRADGTDMNLEMHAIKVADEESLFLLYVNDITDLKKTKEVLTLNTGAYKAIFENAFEGIFIFDLRSQATINCNQKLADYFGMSIEEAIDDSFVEMMPEIQANGQPSRVFFEEHIEIMLQQDNLQIECRLQRKDKSVFDAEVILQKLPRPNNHLVYILLKDISEKNKLKAKEQELLLKQTELDSLHRELTSYTLMQSQQNQLIQEINTELSKLTRRDVEYRQNIVNTLKQKIKTQINSGKQWEKFQLYYEKVHPFFFLRLKKDFPRLTAKELKHCAFVQLNLSIREVANLLFIEGDSVQMARYRIKKKMNLKKEDKLKIYLDLYAKAK